MIRNTGIARASLANQRSDFAFAIPGTDHSEGRVDHARDLRGTDLEFYSQKTIERKEVVYSSEVDFFTAGDALAKNKTPETRA